MVWEVVFMLVVLKIPVVYLCAVVWWAIKAEPPRPPASVAVHESVDPPPTCDWSRRHGPGRLGPRTGRGGRLLPGRRLATAQLRARGTVQSGVGSTEPLQSGGAGFAGAGAGMSGVGSTEPLQRAEVPASPAPERV